MPHMYHQNFRTEQKSKQGEGLGTDEGVLRIRLSKDNRFGRRSPSPPTSVFSVNGFASQRLSVNAQGKRAQSFSLEF